jgi:hypothetical protein
MLTTNTNVGITWGDLQLSKKSKLLTVLGSREDDILAS